MTTQHPEALRLADELDAVPETGADPQTIQEAAAELRRQHTRIAELEARIKTMAEEHADELLVAHLDGMRAAPNASYSPEDRAFHQFWYSHMFEDLMQPPLIGIPHSTARYIWDAALRTAHVQKPAEIEHVAWDVSKNGAEMNTTGAVHADEQAAFEAVAKADTSNVSFIRDDTGYVDMTAALLWPGWKLRASHGQASAQAAPVRGSPADLPPLPDPDLRDVGTTPRDIKEFLRGYATEYALTALTARASADSLLKDAARYRWLREHRSIDLHANPSVPWVVRCEFQPIPTTTAIVGEALDAAIDAARKQGANHD